MLRRLLNNWQLKLLAVAIALALWIFVVGQEKAEITVKVPVEITNIPKQVVVAGDVVPAVNVRLYGPRSLTRRVAEKRLAKNVSLTGMRPGEHSYQVLPEDLDLPPRGAPGAQQSGQLHGGAEKTPGTPGAGAPGDKGQAGQGL